MDIKKRIRRGKSNKALVLLHGYGASMDDLFPLADYLDPNQEFDMIFPNAPVTVPIGPHMDGYAWFALDMAEIERAMMSGTHRSYVENKPNGFEQGLAEASATVGKLVEGYDSYILGGFSQGGMIASHLCLAGSLHPSALILMSTTLVAKSELSEGIIAGQQSFPVFLSHGYSDPVLSPKIAEEFASFLQEAKLPVQTDFFQGGHEIPLQVIQKIAEFIKMPNL